MKEYNALDMKGRLFDYALEEKENDKGAVIAGTISLEVDEKGTVITESFYVNEMTNAGKKNKTYGVLADMLAGNYKTIVNDGEDASWLGLTGKIDASWFMSKKGGNELIRGQKLGGGFINDNKEKKYSNRWKLDFLITDIKEVDADEEKQLPRFVRVSGFLVDGYRKRVMDVQFQARTEKAMDYILGNIGSLASIDSPYFVSTWGAIEKTSRLVVRKNAFGEDEQDEFDSFLWSIIGMNPEPYAFGDEGIMTETEYKEFRDELEAYKEEKADAGNAIDGGGKKPDLAF